MQSHFVSLMLLLLLAVPPVAAQRIPISPEAKAMAREYSLLEHAGLAAARAHDYGDAVLDLRRATGTHWMLIYPSTFAELGMALDHLGKRDEAFANYRKAFGAPVPATLSIQHEGPDMVEALARYGTLCEDRGLRVDAVQCFNRALPSGDGPLYGSLDTGTAPPALVRAMLDDVRGAALEDEGRFGKERSAEAMAAFQAAVRLAPDDARPYFFLANGLRHAGRFTEAEAAVRKASGLDTSGDLKMWAEESLKSISERQRD